MHCLSLIKRQMSLSIIGTDVAPVGAALLGGLMSLQIITNSPQLFHSRKTLEILEGITKGICNTCLACRGCDTLAGILAVSDGNELLHICL